MPHLEDAKRRQCLQYAALGTMAAALPGFTLAEDRPINNTPDPAFKPDVEVELTAQIAEVSILPGANTRVFQYQGKLLKGPSHSLKRLCRN